MACDAPTSTCASIADLSSSESSPVGIDAERTHVLSIHLLARIDRGLEEMGARLASLEERAREATG